jgi:hypothetical protein
MKLYIILLCRKCRKKLKVVEASSKISSVNITKSLYIMHIFHQYIYSFYLLFLHLHIYSVIFCTSFFPVRKYFVWLIFKQYIFKIKKFLKMWNYSNTAGNGPNCCDFRIFIFCRQVQNLHKIISKFKFKII